MSITGKKRFMGGRRFGKMLNGLEGKYQEGRRQRTEQGLKNMQALEEAKAELRELVLQSIEANKKLTRAVETAYKEDRYQHISNVSLQRLRERKAKKLERIDELAGIIAERIGKAKAAVRRVMDENYRVD